MSLLKRREEETDKREQKGLKPHLKQYSNQVLSLYTCFICCYYSLDIQYSWASLERISKDQIDHGIDKEGIAKDKHKDKDKDRKDRKIQTAIQRNIINKV